MITSYSSNSNGSQDIGRGAAGGGIVEQADIVKSSMLPMILLKSSSEPLKLVSLVICVVSMKKLTGEGDPSGKPICALYEIDQSSPSRNSTFGGLIALRAANSTFPAVIVIVFTAGTYFLVPPFSWMMTLNDHFKDSGAEKYGEPPYGHAELSSLKTFSKKLNLDLS